MENVEYMKKFKRCILEYTEFGREEMEEDDPNAAAPMDPNAAAMPAGDPNAMMGGDPNAMGGAAMGGADMNGDGMPDDPNAMGGAAGADAAAVPPEGFAPQVDPAQAAAPEENADEEVIDVDELTNSQEDTEKKIDALTGKFERLMGALDSIEQRLADTDKKMDDFTADMEKRNPTPVEKMTLRSKKSYPFTETPEEYWEKDAPENYSTEDDENGANMPEYQITKDDIDNFSDWHNISKTFDDERKQMGLRDLLGY